MQINKDCRFFKGDIPCEHHKKSGVHCWDCKFYEPVDKKILIIKLGAAGDVIRTTPLLHKIKQTYPNAEITWITYFPDLVPGIVDDILNFELKNILYLINIPFDIVINLDKDKEACALVNMINAKIKKGFRLKSGKIIPLNKDAEHKWLTGLFDDENRKNRKNYMEEMFEMCSFEFNQEKYILDKTIEKEWTIEKNRKVIGLNTGCGGRWTSRSWPVEYWVELVKLLKSKSYNVVLLGGEEEDCKNKLIQKKAGAEYLGCFSIGEFIDLMDQCDLVVTSVTMALHIAIGLKKRVVLFNNIFNRYEFELYGLGEIIEPDVPCIGCYKSVCDKPCMERIIPKKVFEVCNKLLELTV